MLCAGFIQRKKIKVAIVFQAVLFVPLLLTTNGFAQGTPAMESGLLSIRPAPEIRHARDAALAVYPHLATRLDLPPLTPVEQEAVIDMVNDPAQMYVGIGRSAHLLPSNWAMVKQEDGFAVWQAQIHSPAALFLQVRFTNFNLGGDLAVKVYSLEDSSSVHVWEYTGRGPGDNGTFWSSPVPGDTVVVEYWRPAGDQKELEVLPFSIARISHTFRDEQGDVAGLDSHYFQAGQENSCSSPGRQICASSPTSNEPDNVLMASKGIARYQVNSTTGTSWRCSGSLLNNGAEAPPALYFLTAWHCIDTQVGDLEDATTEISLASVFEFRADKCNTTSRYIRGTGSNFVAGSEEGDWALLRIAGDLKFFAGEVAENGVVGFLGWDADARSDFEGFIVHHGDARDQTLARFESEGLSFYAFSSVFPRCTGPECSHFRIRFDDANPPGGSSGSPGFPDGTAMVVGVFTHGDRVPGCEGQLSRFSQMYQDGRVRGALTYGNDYFNGTGPAKGFDDSQRPVYSRYSCEGGGVDLAKAQGSGTAEDPYQLTTLCQLQDMDSSLTAHYQLSTHIDAIDSRLLHGGLGFEPIGGSTVLSAVIESDADGIDQIRDDFIAKITEYAFNGSFDGAGFEIRDLKIARPRQDFVGLFSIVSAESRLQRINFPGAEITGREAVGAVAGAVLGGTVSGVRLVRSMQPGQRTFVEGRRYIGGISGYRHSGNIENVDIAGEFRGSTQVGGIVGYNHSGNIANVLVLAETTISGREKIGGVAGYSGSGDIQDIVLNAKVTAERNNVGGSDYVGGLVGYSESGDIRRVYLKELTVSGTDYVGGLIGYKGSGTLEDIFSSNQEIDVKGENDVGGLVGFNENSSIVRSHVAARVQGTNRVGGLVGNHQGGRIYQCFATGTVSELPATVAAGPEDGNGGGFGGLVGVNRSTISNSYAMSIVSGSTQTGGLVGSNQGSIQQSYADSQVSGKSEVGGLAGFNNAVIANSYALPALQSTDDTTGLLVGRNDGGSTPGSAVRSREQLRCTTEPGVACQGATSYSDWSTQIWNFGNKDTLPGIRGIPLVVPLISSFFGSTVTTTDQFTACLLPGESTLDMPAVAQGAQSEGLIWRLGKSPAVMTTARFVVSDNDDGSTMISGTTMVQVRYERDPDKVRDSDFVLSLEDESGQYDQLTVTMLEMNSSPMIYYRSLSQEVEIGETSTATAINLSTDFACDGVQWSLKDSIPTGLEALFFPSEDGQRVTVELPLPNYLGQARFTIQVAVRENVFRGEITLKVVRRSPGFPVRIKVFLGGAVR